MDDSWVSRLVSSNASSPTAALLTTACISPVPSRTTRNAILPPTRLWRSHPRTVASCPAYRAISLTSEIGMGRVYIRVTDIDSPHPDLGWPTYCAVYET